MSYPKPKPGEWIFPRRKGYKMACCDCGLVHRLDFSIQDRHILFRAYRDRRATAAIRRWMKKKAK